MADSQGSSALHVAAMEQNANAADLLVARGDIDGYDSDGALPLMICAGKGLLEVVASLPNSGANAAHRSYSRRTCRHIVLLQLPHDQPHQLTHAAAKHGCAVAEVRVDAHARHTSGSTPRHIAAKSGNIHMLRCFMGNGGDATVTDVSGRSCPVQPSRDNLHCETRILIERIKRPPSAGQGVRAFPLPPLCLS